MTHKRDKSRPSLLTALRTLACIVLFLAPALWGAWAYWRESVLSAYCEHGLATASPEQAEASLRALRSLGRPGLTAIVRALGAESTTIRRRASNLLSEELDRCQAAAGETTARRVAELAWALAENIEYLPNDARQIAAELTTKVLNLAEQMPMADRQQVTIACQQVFAASWAERNVNRAAAAVARPAATAAQTISGAQPPLRPATRKQAAAKRAAELPTGLAPIHFDLPALARADESKTATSAEPSALLVNEAAVAPVDAGTNDNQSATIASYASETEATSDEANAGQAAARRRAREADVIELFQQLHEPEPAATAAQAELDDRGFSPRQVEVGRHLVSADAAERLQWAEALPGIRGIDARFWLLRLSHDPNAEVRRTAVGFLATDRDPEVVRRLRRVVVEESDERIRESASRALEEP